MNKQKIKQIKKNQYDFQKLTFRCPPELHDALLKSAAKNNTSLNYEMINRLTATLLDDKNVTDLTRRFASKILNHIQRANQSHNEIKKMLQSLNQDNQKSKKSIG